MTSVTLTNRTRPTSAMNLWMTIARSVTGSFRRSRTPFPILHGWPTLTDRFFGIIAVGTNIPARRRPVAPICAALSPQQRPSHATHCARFFDRLLFERLVLRVTCGRTARELPVPPALLIRLGRAGEADRAPRLCLEAFAQRFAAMKSRTICASSSPLSSCRKWPAPRTVTCFCPFVPGTCARN